MGEQEVQEDMENDCGVADKLARQDQRVEDQQLMLYY